MKFFLKSAFAVILLCAFFASAFAQRSTRLADKVQPLTQEEATERWGIFLNSGFAEYYSFKIELEHRPRKGKASFFDALMSGRHTPEGFSVRLDVFARGSNQEGISFLLISKNGKSQIFKSQNGKVEKLDEAQWQNPLMEGLIYTPFDALMPYKNWEWHYYGPGRVGRALHFFDLKAPPEFAENAPNFAIVRVALSREFNAPYQTEYFTANGELMRTLSLSSVKKFQESWVPKKIEMFDEKTRDKDVITISQGSFASLPSDIFDPKNLAQPTPLRNLESL